MKKSLIIFISGILFVSYIIPLLDGLSSWFLTWVETKKIKHGKLINQANFEAQDVEIKTPQMGFYIPEENEYKDEESENDF